MTWVNMHKRPLGVISVFFIIGIVLGRFLPDSVTLFHVFVVTLILITLTLTLSLKRTREAHGFLFLSIISVGSLLYLNSNIFPPNHISHFLGKDKVKTEIIGVIESPSEARGVYYGKISSRYIFKIESIDGLKITGLALIKIQTEKDYQYGDRLMVKGTIKRPLTPTLSPKGRGSSPFNYRKYLENQDIFAIVNASEKNVTLLSHNYKVNPVVRFAYFVREKLKEQFLKKMPLESGAFLRAILLGDRSELPKNIQESFRNSGTMHILAISGLNVSLIAVSILYMFRVFRITRWVSYVLVILVLSFLSVLTGGTPSVVRATVMTCIFLIGMLFGRKADVYNSLGAAAFFLLIINPKDLFDIGFQLSFTAIASMAYFTPKFMSLTKEGMNHYIKKYLYVPLAVSVSASIGSFPLIWHYFGIFTPIAIFANLFIVPLMSVLLAGALIFASVGWMPFIGGWIGFFNHALAQLIFFFAWLFSQVKFGHFYLS